MGNSCVSASKVRRKKSTLGDDYIDGVDETNEP